MKNLKLLCIALVLSAAAKAQFLPTIMAAPDTICSGVSTRWMDATPGGVWSSSNPSVATIVSTTGAIVGISGGVDTIYYNVGTDTVAAILTVRQAPPSVTGPSYICGSGSVTLADSVTGGTWISATPSVITIDPATGVATALMMGTVRIDYVAPDRCTPYVPFYLTVGRVPVIYNVEGDDTFCVGGTGGHISLSGSDNITSYQLFRAGSAVGSAILGTGSALDFGIFSTGGTYVAIATDTASGCTATMMGSGTMVTYPAPTVFRVSASSATCGLGKDILLDNSDAGVSYQLMTGATPVGTPVAGTGTVLDYGLHTTTGTYTVIATNDFTACTSAMLDSVVVSGNTISGNITYSGGSPTDIFKVWLIQFHPSDSSIAAVDSTTTCMASGVPYYEFDGEPAGSYMAKASLEGSVPGASGYIPTYSLSTPFWNSAASVAHAGGSDALPITMVYGTVPAGPGFISGYVYAGAGRGTSGDIPAVGMLVYLTDVTGRIITYAYTSSTGQFSFPSLVNGNYIVRPEAYKYYTTPSSTITLSAASESITNVNFKQHTSFGVITPIGSETVTAHIAGSNAISIYPNPANDELTIQADGYINSAYQVTNGLGQVLIQGQLVANNTVVTVRSLPSGLYYLSVKGDNGRTVQEFVKE